MKKIVLMLSFMILFLSVEKGMSLEVGARIGYPFIFGHLNSTTKTAYPSGSFFGRFDDFLMDKMLLEVELGLFYFKNNATNSPLDTNSYSVPLTASLGY